MSEFCCKITPVDNTYYRHISALSVCLSQAHLAITSKEPPSRDLFYVEATY